MKTNPVMEEIISEVCLGDEKLIKERTRELSGALNSYPAFISWLNSSTAKDTDRIIASVMKRMKEKRIFSDAHPIVRDRIKDMSHKSGLMRHTKIPEDVYERQYGFLKCQTHKFMGGRNSISSYKQKGRDKAKINQLHTRLERIAGKRIAIRYENGSAIKDNKQYRDLSKINELIFNQTGINCLNGYEFTKYPIEKKITSLNEVLRNSMKSKKFSMENDMAGQLLLQRFTIDIEKRCSK